MSFKKILAGFISATMVANMSITAFTVPVYYTDSFLEPNEDFSNMTLATIVDETVAEEDISSFTYTLTCADDVSFNEWAYIYFVVTVDGVAEVYAVQGITGEDEWTFGLILSDQTLVLNSTISAGSTYKVEAYTQSWEDTNDYVFDVEFDVDATSSSSALASGTCGDELTWVLSEDGVLTISGTGEMYDYTTSYLPTSSGTVPWYSYKSNYIESIVIEEGVTSVGNYAFYYCPKLISAVLPDSLTIIGDNAFGLCSDLVSVDLSEGLTNVGDNAFWGCGSLVSIDLPDSLTSIGDSAFSCCESLTDVNISDNITYIGEHAFSYCDGLADNNGFVIVKNVLYSYCGENLEIEIPNNVVALDSWAFAENDITSVVISEGVEEIGDSAFEYDVYLENVEISNTVTTIGALAFYGCEGLTSVTIPSSVTSIGGSAFGYYLGENGGDKVEGFTIYGYSGTAAEAYAEENGFTFIDLDGTSTAEVILGDANSDDEINYLDAMAVLRYDAELMELTDVQLAAADVNDDGSVNSLDAILILRYDAGLIASFAE